MHGGPGRVFLEKQRADERQADAGPTGGKGPGAGEEGNSNQTAWHLWGLSTCESLLRHPEIHYK